MTVRTAASVSLVTVAVCVGAWCWGGPIPALLGPPQFGEVGLASPGPSPGADPAARVSRVSAPYQVYLPVSNPGPGTLRAQVTMQGAPSEVSGSPSGFEVPVGGSGIGIGVGYISPHRTRPVLLRLSWQQGTSQGSRTYTIPTSKTDSRL